MARTEVIRVRESTARALRWVADRRKIGVGEILARIADGDLITLAQFQAAYAVEEAVDASGDD